MKIYLVFTIFLFKTCTMEAQINIEDVSIYNYFPERGFTTAGLSTELKALKERQVERFALAAGDVDVIEKIMSNSKVKKHTQTKTGGGAFFGIIQKKSEAIDVIIFSNLIIDMTNYVNYWVIDEKDQSFLTELLLKIKKENKRN